MLYRVKKREKNESIEYTTLLLFKLDKTAAEVKKMLDEANGDDSVGSSACLIKGNLSW